VRFKITLEIDAAKFGNILPISYQYELVSATQKLLTSDNEFYENWLSLNRLNRQDAMQTNLYSISNLYVPKIFVEGDRLHINVPRIQFWISFYPTINTDELLKHSMLGQKMVIGDDKSSVAFVISDIQTVSPVKLSPIMEYQTLSPLVIVGLRPNQTIEYLSPRSLYFPQFMVDGLIERWEFLNGREFRGNRRYKFELLQPERRKAVTVFTESLKQQKIVGYMIKFRLYADPELQEIAYTLGLGDHLNLGFGYLELLKKEAN